MTHPLTPRQIEIAQLKADGLSQKEIAARLGIKKRTVKSDTEIAREEMGLRTFHDVVIQLYLDGMIK